MRWLPLLLAALFINPASAADPEAPWGHGKAVAQAYTKQKVVYDVTVSTESAMRSVISRAQLLVDLNGSDPFDNKVVIVLHGKEIPFFAVKNLEKHRELMQRAQSATQTGLIEFRMCKLAAEGHGFQPEDIHGFVGLVPMADAEIVRLQQEGYAYMR
ncbi:MAG: DsrE family protein [Pseudomonadota bacterium]|nr:DsrE family protein [Pseudomonadota bacterium]MDP1572679.1 DsrE family protein [Pseudomonadota bacterium]MDP1906552.1 DsrE family protein [Pseudomonadota bacterium]